MTYVICENDFEVGKKYLVLSKDDVGIHIRGVAEYDGMFVPPPYSEFGKILAEFNITSPRLIMNGVFLWGFEFQTLTLEDLDFEIQAHATWLVDTKSNP